MARVQVLRNFARAPWPVLFGLAGFGLVLSARNAGHASLPAVCGSSGTASLLLSSGGLGALQLALALNPPVRLMADWAMMLLAMMPPLLAVPLMHVWRSSLPRRRVRAVAHFAIGYGCAWMAIGPILIGLALLLQLLLQFAGGGGGLTFACALLLAMLWSAAPWQRAALNRSHRLARIGLFGWAADRECLTFGLVHAGWCIASCWAWMLAALVAGLWHVPTMTIAGAIMLGERLAAPDRPRWRVPTWLFQLDPGPILVRQREVARHG
jgi:predicted metal-binding membrane protein